MKQTRTPAGSLSPVPIPPAAIPFPVTDRNHSSLKDVLGSWMHREPGANCILAPSLPALSYRGLFDQICHVESQLRAAGIGPGECIASALPNGPDAATAFLTLAAACLYAPLNPADDANALEFAFQHLNPAAVVLKTGEFTQARAAAERTGIKIIELRSPEGLEAGRFKLTIPDIFPGSHNGDSRGESGLLLQSSGTTARPKFVRHTHSTLLHAAAFLSRANQLTPRDRCLNIAPLFHSLGLTGSVLLAAVSGGSVVCTAGFEREKFFDWIEAYSPTWFSAVPTIQMAIGELAAEHQDTLRRRPLRFSRSAGARLPKEIRRKIEIAIHAPIVQAYGMSECPPIAVDPLSAERRKLDSVGLPAGPQVEIWDDFNAPVGPSCSGHVVVRGPNVTPGYYKDAAANRAAFTDGWFRTGDCGYLDEDGFLFLTGRVSEFINRGGEKVAPGEIDEILSGHPDVAQAVTFASHDDRLGEEVASLIVPRHEGALTVEQLTRFAAARLAFHKIPRRIYLVSQIPAGRTGKYNRAALRARFEREPPQPDEPVVPRIAPRTDLEKKIAGVWSRVLGVENPGIHDSFFDSGGDSLAAASLFAGLADASGAEELTLGDLITAPTIAELAILLSTPAQRTHPCAHPCVRPLKPGGSGVPLFWIGGFAAPAMVKTLDRNRPVFLISLPDPPNTDADHIIGQYAEECCRNLRRFRPQGPYLLAGWCAMSVIALEAARRLQAEGEKVGLIFFDARGVLRQSPWISIVRAAQKLVYHLRRMPTEEASHAAGYITERVTTLSGRARRRLLDCRRLLLTAFHNEPPAGFGNCRLLFSMALRHYRPKPYSGRIVHIWAADRPKGKYRDLQNEWGPAGNGCVQLHETPGAHITMFQGENGVALGRLLTGCLNEMERNW